MTASAMLAELFRRDKKGFTLKRKAEDKLILTCRYTAILIAAILKSKGIPCRVRSGHAPYFNMGELGDVTTDHWINQYWDKKEKRWVTIDDAYKKLQQPHLKANCVIDSVLSNFEKDRIIFAYPIKY